MVLSDGANMTTLFLLALLSNGHSAVKPPEPQFGADTSVGYAVGHVVGTELTKRTNGSAIFRLDSFVQDRNYEGPRLGMSVWGGMSLGPKPSLLATTELGKQVTEHVKINHVGILAIIRQQAEAPFSGTFGVGFGRIEMTTNTDGQTALPAFTIEAGGRYKTSRQSFIDLMARAHWVTRQNSVTQQQEDWWFLELSTMVGAHLR